DGGRARTVVEDAAGGIRRPPCIAEDRRPVQRSQPPRPSWPQDHPGQIALTMASILVLAGVNGAGKSSLLGMMLREDGATWFNPDAFTRQLVESGWPLEEANATAWLEGTRRLREAMAG